MHWLHALGLQQAWAQASAADRGYRCLRGHPQAMLLPGDQIEECVRSFITCTPTQTVCGCTLICTDFWEGLGSGGGRVPSRQSRLCTPHVQNKVA